MRNTTNFLRLTLAVVCLSGSTASAQDISFNRDIRPILSDKCNFCHGPDESTREADLRFDVLDDARYVFESGELIDRINSDDEDMRMPPPASKLALSQDEKDLLKQWIDEGASFEEHWAFELLPETVPVPQIDVSPTDLSRADTQDPWSRNDIDRFVLSNLNRHHVEPNPEAPAWKWFRRVCLDLTGLPPSPEQIAHFQSDIDQYGVEAYERAVDRFLADESFGEHMAVGWLDLARYADSYGYQSDKLNTQWPYRDWVVKAFNDNLAYDKFLTWQIAGDLIEKPTREQRLATAFNRIHRLNNEGGAVFEEWRIENVADRVHTLGTAVLGLTMECSRCHDHKYDPISMRDYYSLSAFFNSIDESGVYDRSEKVPCPSLLLPNAEQEKQLEQAALDQQRAEQNYEEQSESAKERWTSWRESSPQQKPIPDLALALAFDREFDDAVKDVYHPSESDRRWTSMPELVTVEDSPFPRLDASIANDQPEDDQAEYPRRAMSLDGERGATTEGIEPLDRWIPFTVLVTLRERQRVTERSLIAHHTRGTDCGYNGWDLTIVDGHLESRLYRVWPGNAIGVRSLEPIPLDQWHQVAATYDGSSTAAGLQIYLNGKPLEIEILRDEMKKSANVKVDHGGQFVIGQRFRARGLAGGLIDDVRLYWRDLTEAELTSLATGKPVEPTLEYFVSAVDEPSRTAWQELNARRKAYVLAEEAIHEIPTMIEEPKPRETHLLLRGQYDAPTSDETLVERAVIESLNLPFPEDQPKNRLGLARWITDPRHPLTARVAVNQLWGNFFEQPLVRTPENFGLQGELPTHPELLDWLARDFVDSGWDVKRLCKQIVLSSTYRQDSTSRPDLAEVDPTNRWLARGPSYRLSAEQIRDLALAASGLLNRTMGGPPVSPYQPGEDLWREANSMSPAYKQSVGKSLYRRSLYSVWKRTVPLPNMMAFDTTTREVCTVKRSRTNTPLQALVLLNDVQFVEAARVLGQSLSMLDDDAERISVAFEKLGGRRPTENELEVLLDLLDSERKHYQENPEDARTLLSSGEAPFDDSSDVPTLAALTTVCQAILNLDATIWKR